ncbi:MAG: AMP-binding protein, partial [Nitrosopumilus sp.]|nr:AMP-binding protein [Nitrosopumilus sp.]
MSDFEFVPTEKQIQESNIYKFMKKHNLLTLNDLSDKSKNDLEWYWKSVDEDIGVVWDKPYTKILDNSKGIAWSKWFVDGKTNLCKSSVEKFAKKSPEKIAYYFESEDGKKSKISYSELNSKVSKLANGLKSMGAKKGDVIAIYLPMIEEAILSILAAAKIGAIQTVIFSGYSSESLHVRLKDCSAKFLIISDGFYRKGKPVSQKKSMEIALVDTFVEKTILVPYKGIDEYAESENIVFYDKLVSTQSDSCDTEILDSEDPLFILYTSGTTGKPKGVIHTHGGFSVFAGHQAAYLIDLQAQDTLFWPADIGWITGLVWNIYGLLMIGASAVIYDGGLDFPTSDRLWRMLSEYG